MEVWRAISSGSVFLTGGILVAHIVGLETEELAHGRCPVERVVCDFERTPPSDSTGRHPAPGPTAACMTGMTVSGTTSTVPTLSILSPPPATR